MGTNISEIVELGLSKVAEDVNICPNINYDSKNGIKLDLDPECSWNWEGNRTYIYDSDGHGDKFYKHFH